MREGDGMVFLLWNYFSGAPLDGQRRSNATWTRRGNVVYADKGIDARLPGRWHQLAQLERMAVRWVVALVVAAGVYRPEPTLTALAWASGITATVVLAWAGYRATGALLTWRHRRDWVWPLHTALHDQLGYPPMTPPRRYLDLPTDFTEPDAPPVVIHVPADFKGAELEKSAIVRIARDKLALGDVSWSWHLDSRNSFVAIRTAKRPPLEVLFSVGRVASVVAKAPESSPVIGLTTNDVPVSVDLDSESPHVLIAAGTGGGKSVILRAITAQLMHHGATVSVIDRKRHSHKWIRGLPGVDYWRDLKEIHDGLVALGVEGDRRNRIVDEHEDDESAPDVGPRHVILLEEANATIGRLKRYWAAIRDPKTDPKESPALEALGEILFMGRAVKMHVLLVAQSATAAALGGPEMRENFATRILARYTMNQLKMLAPEISPAPKSTRHIGRAQVILGGKAHETQVVFFSDDEARAWGTSGAERPTVTVTASQAMREPSSLGKEPVTVSATEDAPHLRVVAETEHEPAPVTLREACETGVLTVSLAVARKARSGRDPEFPEAVDQDGQAELFDPRDLQRWERNRPGNKTGESA